jgi:hypothetical protein
VLRGACAGDHADGRLELTENRRLPRSEPHVACQHELAANAAHATLDLRDRDEAAGAQVAKQEADRRLPGKFRRRLPVLFDPGYIDVSNEIIGVGAREHDYLDGIIGLGSLNE